MKTEFDYKYCLLCGGNLSKTGPSLLTCEKCGYRVFLNARPAAGVILRFQNTFGLCKRAIEPKKGLWDTIGGFVDYTENIEEALKREVREEAGIELENFRYIGSRNHDYIYQDVLVRPLGMIFESVLEKIPTIVAQDDIDEVRFFNSEEFPLDELAFPQFRDLFAAYITEI